MVRFAAWSMILAFAGLSLLAAVPTASADGSQTFHLNLFSQFGFDERELTKVHGGATGGAVLSSNDEWATHISADSDVDLSGEWSFNIRARITSGSHIAAVTAQLGKASGGACSYVGNDAVTLTGPAGTEGTFTGTDPDAAVNLQSGDRFCLKVAIVSNAEQASHEIVDVDPGDSFIQTPESDPGFPAYSAATIVVVAAGGMLVAGAAFINRRR